MSDGHSVNNLSLSVSQPTQRAAEIYRTDSRTFGTKCQLTPKYVNVRPIWKFPFKESTSVQGCLIHQSSSPQPPPVSCLHALRVSYRFHKSNLRISTNKPQNVPLSWENHSLPLNTADFDISSRYNDTKKCLMEQLFTNSFECRRLHMIKWQRRFSEGPAGFRITSGESASNEQNFSAAAGGHNLQRSGSFWHDASDIVDHLQANNPHHARLM